MLAAAAGTPALHVVQSNEFCPLRPNSLLRCHKWSGLTMEQVRACLQAASRGEEWRPAGTEDAAADSGGVTDDGQPAAAVSSGGSGGRTAAEASAADKLASAGAGGGSLADGAAAAAAAGGQGSSKRTISSSVSGRMTLFGALLAWMGIVGMFLSILPRLYHRAKQRASRAGAATKLSV